MRRLQPAIGWLQRLWDDGSDAFFVAGVAFVTWGAWEVAEWLGKIVLGVFLLLGWVLLAIRGAKRPRA